MLRELHTARIHVMDLKITIASEPRIKDLGNRTPLSEKSEATIYIRTKTRCSRVPGRCNRIFPD